MFDRFFPTSGEGSAKDSDPQQAPQSTPEDYDALYGMPEDGGTPDLVEGAELQTDADPSGRHVSNEYDQMRQEMNALKENFEKRLSDKDRYIGELRGELTGLSKLAGLGQQGGSQPSQEADPPLFDEESINLIRQGMESDPATTLTQVASHIREVTKADLDKESKAREAQSKQQALAQQVMTNVTTQCNQLKKEFPEIADTVDEFLNSGNPGENPIGKTIQADPTLLQSRSGIYTAVKAQVLSERVQQASGATQQERPSMNVNQGTTYSTPPSGADRRVGEPRTQEKSVEEKIADSIVNSDAKRRDQKLRNLMIG